MPWINVKETWTHIEGPTRTVDYHPGKHNVTAAIAAAFEGKGNIDDDADRADAQGGADSAETEAGVDGAGAGDIDLSQHDAG